MKNNVKDFKIINIKKFSEKLQNLHEDQENKAATTFNSDSSRSVIRADSYEYLKVLSSRKYNRKWVYSDNY